MVSVGDRIRCVNSTRKDRIGKEWDVVPGGGKPTKTKAPKWWVSHCASYGDEFEVIKPKKER